MKLNKAIRLYKATGIVPEDIWQVVESINDDLTIDSNVLSKLFYVQYYEGGWNSPFNFNVSNKINKNSVVGIYYSSDYEKEMFIIYFYEKKDNYSSNNIPASKGITINPDMTFSILTKNDLDAIVKSTLSEIDTKTEYKVNNQFYTDYLVEYKDKTTIQNKISSLTGEIIDLPYTSPKNGHVKLSFNPSIEINFSKVSAYNNEIKYLISMVDNEVVILFDYDRHDEILGKYEENVHYGTLDFIISIDLKNPKYSRVLMHGRTKEKIPEKSLSSFYINDILITENDNELKINIMSNWKDNI
ncbi:hypothetical protein KKJ06_21375 [Xenorhabdus bovienii]|uniref:hypothetical protein n=1 Tax=Xenorhabdus bovienii TaxID=40576 RepID=UPI0023B2489E|nr:hypothetical protein [Xenorhabdus bovienii]MDE9557868.1 hypothetical protein [Xenorhabdus bovienii]